MESQNLSHRLLNPDRPTQFDGPHLKSDGFNHRNILSDLIYKNQNSSTINNLQQTDKFVKPF